MFSSTFQCNKKWNNKLRQQQGFSGGQLFLIVLATIVFTVAVTFFVIRTYIFPAPFTPVTLNVKEEQRLENKLSQLGWQVDSSRHSSVPSKDNAVAGKKEPTTLDVKPVSRVEEQPPQPLQDQVFEPEAYSEVGADRQVTFSEKEVNSMIGRNSSFAQRLVIDFSDNLASAKMLIPVPNDFPIMAGETLRVNAGLDIHLDHNRRPAVALVGVSLMGVPIPNAWLGNMKNVNLVSEFGDRGFWNTFADGVENIQIREGELQIKLRK